MTEPVDGPIRIGWVLPTSAIMLVMIIAGSALVLAHLLEGAGSSTAGPSAAGELSGATQASRSTVGAPAAATPGPATRPSRTELVAAALKVKPLEDIEKGDRVIYQGHVCVWLLWNKNINTSTIRCPGERAFQIETGRLTPVELKTHASKLKVEH